jgi:uncharacterized protein YneF (UPF0154 family)
MGQNPADEKGCLGSDARLFVCILIGAGAILVSLSGGLFLFERYFDKKAKYIGENAPLLPQFQRPQQEQRLQQDEEEQQEQQEPQQQQLQHRSTLIHALLTIHGNHLPCASRRLR